MSCAAHPASPRWRLLARAAGAATAHAPRGPRPLRAVAGPLPGLARRCRRGALWDSGGSRGERAGAASRGREAPAVGRAGRPRGLGPHSRGRRRCPARPGVRGPPRVVGRGGAAPVGPGTRGGGTSALLAGAARGVAPLHAGPPDVRSVRTDLALCPDSPDASFTSGHSSSASTSGAEALAEPSQAPAPFYTVPGIAHLPEEPRSQTEAPAGEAGGAAGGDSREEQGWGGTARPWVSEMWEGLEEAELGSRPLGYLGSSSFPFCPSPVVTCRSPEGLES